jgi:hypothetical protein
MANAYTTIEFRLTIGAAFPHHSGDGFNASLAASEGQPHLQGRTSPPAIAVLQICNPLFNFGQASRQEGSMMISGWVSA